jgi:hypothetical protein
MQVAAVVNSLTARVEMLSGNKRSSAFRTNTPDRMVIENIEDLAPNNFNTGLSDADLLRMNTTELDRFLSNAQLSDEQQELMKDKRDDLLLCEKADLLEQRLQDMCHENKKQENENKNFKCMTALCGRVVEAMPPPKS